MNPTRYVALLKLLGKQSLAQMLTYRMTSTFIIVFGTLFAFADIIGTVVFFQYTESIAGWEIYDFLVLLSTFQFISYLYQFFFVASHENLMENILNGKLDYDLLRPVDSLFLCSMKQLDFPSVINMIIPSSIFFYCLPYIKIELNFLNVLIYILFVALGVIFYYLLNQMFVCLAFWVDRPQKIAGVPEYMLDFASRPREVYPRILQIILSTVFPVITAVNLPAEYLKGSLSINYFVFYLFFLILFGIVVRFQWKWGICRYASAN